MFEKYNVNGEIAMEYDTLVYYGKLQMQRNIKYFKRYKLLFKEKIIHIKSNFFYIEHCTGSF